MGEVKVSLREFRPEDAAAVERWFNDGKVTENMMEVRQSFAAGEAAGWVERAMRTDGADRKWAVLLDAGDTPVGFTALYGIGGELDAHRVYGRIPATNEAAKHVVTWLGWKHEGTMRDHIRRPDGTLIDCEVWGVTATDWAERWRDS